MFEDGHPAGPGPGGRNGSPPDTATATLESLLTGAPGPAAVALLAGIEPGTLDDLGRVLLLRALERQSRWLAALQQRALAAVAGPHPRASGRRRLGGRGGRRSAGAGAGHRRSPDRGGPPVGRPTGRHRRRTGARRDLDAVRGGAGRGDGLPDPLVRAVQARMLPRAGRGPVGRFRRALRRAVALADPIGVEVAHARAVADRGVRFYAEPDGMAVLTARLAAESAECVYTALTALAGPGGAGSPGIEVRRADALVELARTALADPGLPTAHRRRPHVAVTIDLATLLGLAEHPGELAGYGPIPASAARALAADGNWRRLVTDPLTGSLLDHGRTTYTPPAALVDFLLARDGTCRFPGCSLPAVRCDLDHSVAWEDGGGTDRDNLGPLCRRHHRLKTHTGWALRRNADASVTWTSPAGAIYTLPPPTVPPDG